MTVCIAGLQGYKRTERIVLVSDRKVAFGQFSADKAISKDIPFIYRHAVLIAGNDVSRAGSVLQRARRSLSQNKKPNMDEVAETIFESCKAEWDRIAHATVLHKHGYTYEAFTKNGKSMCTDAVFYDIHSELRQVALSLDFLIVGFDGEDTAHIRFVNVDTPPEDYDSLGFWTIGSGKHEALASLSHAVEYLGLNRHCEIGEYIYHLLAAKFMAESAQDVGKDTNVVVLGPTEVTILYHAAGGIDHVRGEWRKSGAPKVPRQIGDAVETFLSIAKQNVYEVALGKAEATAEMKKAAKLSPEIRKLISVGKVLKGK